MPVFCSYGKRNYRQLLDQFGLREKFAKRETFSNQISRLWTEASNFRKNIRAKTITKFKLDDFIGDRMRNERVLPTNRTVEE